MKFKRILLLVISVFIAMQFFQIRKSNPKETASLSFTAIENPPSEILKLMEAACFDCHSYKTEYPWYTYIQPVGWFIENHVTGARKHMNFSEWGNYPNEERTDLREEAAEEILEGHMPPSSFILLHKEAKLSENEKQSLIAWLQQGKTGRKGKNNKGKDREDEESDD